MAVFGFWPIDEQHVVIVAPIHGDNGIRRKRDVSGNVGSMLFSVGVVAI